MVDAALYHFLSNICHDVDHIIFLGDKKHVSGSERMISLQIATCEYEISLPKGGAHGA
jgi:hypothetical protein